MFYLLDHDNEKDKDQNCEDFVNGVFPGPISNPIDGYQKKVVIIKGASSGRYILDSMYAMGIRLFSQMIAGDFHEIWRWIETPNIPFTIIPCLCIEVAAVRNRLCDMQYMS